jgi:outer membrane protein TolC
LRANLRAKKAEFDEAIAGYHELLLRASREVVDQLAMIRFLDEQIEVQRLTLGNVKNHADLTFSRYGTGISPYMDALEVEEKLLETQLQMVDLELKKKQASINLMRALRGTSGSAFTFEEEDLQWLKRGGTTSPPHRTFWLSFVIVVLTRSCAYLLVDLVAL